MEDRTVYLSGPIGNAGKCTPEQQLINVITAEDIYGALMDKGYAVYCPHLSYYPDKRWRDTGMTKFMFNHNKWLEMDLQWVNKCKYFFYMTPEKYGESTGAKREFDFATKLGKKIFTTLDEVPNKLEITI